MWLSGNSRLTAASVTCRKEQEGAHAGLSFIVTEASELIMIVIVLFYLGVFRGLVTQITESLAEENKLLCKDGLC